MGESKDRVKLAAGHKHGLWVNLDLLYGTHRRAITANVVFALFEPYGTVRAAPCDITTSKLDCHVHSMIARALLTYLPNMSPCLDNIIFPI
jgi:hypothetical protein